MAPNSPPPTRSTAPQPTLGPSPTSAQGNHSRSPPLTAPPRPFKSYTGRCNEASSSPQRPTPAEAYANEHHPRREREPSLPAGANRPSQQAHNLAPGGVKAKPLFDWITRKLGAGRRATYSDGSSSLPSVSTSAPRTRNAGRNAKANNHQALPQPGDPLSPTQIFGPATSILDNANSIARSESHSLRSYSMSYANSVERQLRREANNPYPSMPVPAFHRDSTFDTVSESHFSRSRTPSIRSEVSRPRLSMWDVDDGSSRWAGAGADEDASIRPFPPSHPSSPTPSQSLVSPSASTSLLSPVIHRPPRPSSFVGRPRTHRSMSSSSNSSDPGGRQSRQDSTSTKPTTVLSFDSAPHMAHIAQAPSPVSPPPTPNHNMLRPTSLPRQQAASVTTSATPFDSDHAQQTSVPASTPFPGALRTSISDNSLLLAQAPKHSHPHPRDNPHPSSPPEPNASTLTLASSNFAVIPTPVTASLQSHSPMYAPAAATRLRDITTAGPSNYNPLFRPSSLATSPSVTFAPDTGNDRPVSTYEYAPSLHSYYALSAYGPASIRTGGWKGSSAAADRDASVRAVRRKGSWESNESGWSWKGQLFAQGSGAVTPQAGPGAASPQGLLNPIGHRSSAYGIQDDDNSSTYLTAREGLMTRESFVTAQTRLSKGSRGSNASQKWNDGEEETPGIDDKRFNLERVVTPITA